MSLGAQTIHILRVLELSYMYIYIHTYSWVLESVAELATPSISHAKVKKAAATATAYT
jgi:hypothetical protein